MIETIEKYNFKEKIKQLEKYLKKNNLENDDIRKVNKVMFKLRNIDAIIENIDEELLAEDIESKWNEFNNYFEKFSQGNNNYISNMSNVIDSIMEKVLNYVDYNMLLNNKSKIKDYIRNYKLEITKQKNNLETEVSDILDFINDKKNNINNENTELGNKIKEINDKLDDLKNNQDNLVNNVDNFIDKTKDSVENLVTAEKSNIDQLIDDSKTEFDNNFEELSKEYREKFEILLNEIQEKNKKISKLIGIVGDKARIGDYKKNADMSRIERIVWQVITIILFLMAFSLMLYVTITSKDYNKYTIFKYIVSAILMGAATYTAKQASNSRKDEVYYRKQELELASIDVYLENMDHEDKE